jgi:hypothetical protein
MKHKHRILPGHMGGEYVEGNVISVEVTNCNQSTANHVMWHYANWNLWGREEDFLAWRGLAGFYSKEEIIEEIHRVNGKRMVEKRSQEKDDLGRVLFDVRAGERLNFEKDERGKSVNAVKAGKKGHEEKDEKGKSLRNKKLNEKLHKLKDENGKSVFTKETLHSEKDEFGRSLHGLRLSSTVNSKKFRCLVTGKVSTAGPLTRWQKSRGIDTAFREQIT